MTIKYFQIGQIQILFLKITNKFFKVCFFIMKTKVDTFKNSLINWLL